jgi:hypothetical protein
MINSIYKVANNLYFFISLLSLFLYIAKTKSTILSSIRKFCKSVLQMKTGMCQIHNFRCLLITPTTGKYLALLLSDSDLINRTDYTVIMKHLWSKLNSKPKDWRRIFKALHAMEYLIKNGAPRTV